MTLLPLRPNVCMILLNEKGDVFIGERLGEPGVWQLPQGGAEAHLSLEENVLKELEEETGADKSLFKIVRKLKAINDYEFEEIPAYAKGKWRGQSQTFWIVRFLGEDSDFNLARFEAEFQAFAWCSQKDLGEKIEPKRYQGYKKALDELRSED